MSNTYDNVTQYLKMTQFTYNDLARYFAAVKAFHVANMEYNDPLYGTLRDRLSNPDVWNTLYTPIIK